MANATSAPSSVPIPLLSTQQVRKLYQLLTEVYTIEFVQTTENAGWNLALLAKRLLGNDIIDRSIVVLAGCAKYNNGGLVAARHLLNRGAWVQIILTEPVDAFQAEGAQQLATLQAMGAPLAWAEEGWELPPADLFIDAMADIMAQHAPIGKTRDLIQLANSSRAPILSLDLPSGVDSATGQCYTPHIQATATLALALPKQGIVAAQAACGDLYLADIGVPAQLYADLGIAVPLLFAQDTVIPLMIHAESVITTG